MVTLFTESPGVFLVSLAHAMGSATCALLPFRGSAYSPAAGVQAMVPHQLPLHHTPTQQGTWQTPLQLGLSPSPLLGFRLVSLPLLVPLPPLPPLVELQPWPPPAQLPPQLRTRARARSPVVTGQVVGRGQ